MEQNNLRKTAVLGRRKFTPLPGWAVDIAGISCLAAAYHPFKIKDSEGNNYIQLKL